MYKMELTKEEFNLHVNGLDAQVRLLCQQIANSPSAGASLKATLSQLVRLDQQFDKLSAIMQEQDMITRLPEGTGVIK